MIRDTARKPISRKRTYLKFGFVITETESYYCPTCSHVLNAGPGYQPRYCSQCGQRVTFDGIAWKKEKTLGYLPMKQRGGAGNEQKPDRMV